MRLFVVRHGESEANIAGITQGQMNSGLTEKGIGQAKMIAERLKDESFDIVYVSDLDRASSTAKEIIKFHPDVDVVYSPLLRERSAGVFEGKPREEFIEHLDRVGFASFRPEDGESFADCQARAVKFYERLLDDHRGKTVLIVGHGGFFKSLILHLLGRPLEYDAFREIPMSNCSLTVLDIDDNRKHCVRILGSTEHLES